MATELTYARHLAMCCLCNKNSNNLLSFSAFLPSWGRIPLPSHIPFACEGDKMPRDRIAKIDLTSHHGTSALRQAVRDGWLQLLSFVLGQWLSYWTHPHHGLHRVSGTDALHRPSPSYCLGSEVRVGHEASAREG